MNVSPYISRFGAVLLLCLLVWIGLRVGFGYGAARMLLSSEKENVQADYERLLERRLDIPSLERQLSRLTASSRVQASIIRADNSRAAFIRVQQLCRAAVEDANGKLLSSIESGAGQFQDSVAVLIRARVPEGGVSRFLSNVENGNPRLRVDDLALTSRFIKPSETTDVEVTATLRGSWLIAKTVN